MATPASAAPRTGAAPSPQENALRPPAPRPVLELALRVRFDERLWVRVAINSSLAGFSDSTVGGRAAFLLRAASKSRLSPFPKGRCRVPASVRAAAVIRPGFAAERAGTRALSAAPSKLAAVL